MFRISKSTEAERTLVVAWGLVGERNGVRGFFWGVMLESDNADGFTT